MAAPGLFTSDKHYPAVFRFLPLYAGDGLTRMKDAFRFGSYESAVEIALPLSKNGSAVYDEACAVLAMSYLALAKACKDPKDGMVKARKAQDYADKGIFSKREIKASAVLLYDELAEKL